MTEPIYEIHETGSSHVIVRDDAMKVIEYIRIQYGCSLVTALESRGVMVTMTDATGRYLLVIKDGRTHFEKLPDANA
jgi:hypothetical protein